MRIYEDEKQYYIKAALAMGTQEEQEALKAKLDKIDSRKSLIKQLNTAYR